MRFEWDEAKNAENIRKHGIDFVDVSAMFDGPMLIELDEREDYGEDRWIGVGFLLHIVAVVVWTELQDDVIHSQHERLPNMSANDSNNTSRTDWARLEAMTDEEIDYSDISPLTDAFFERAVLRIPAAQARTLIQLDPDVLAWFRTQGAEYKTLINTVLRRYIEGHQD